MIEYQVTYKSKEQGKGTLIFHAKDRNDAIEFAKAQVKQPIKIVSAKQTNKPKSKGGRPRKSLPSDIAPTPVMTEEQVLIHMREKAKLYLIIDAYNGQAIGKYLQLVMATNPNLVELQRAVNWVVRQVENKNETFVQKKF